MFPYLDISLTKKLKMDVEYNILANRTIKINEKYVFEYTKESINSNKDESGILCKILKFSCSFNIDEVLTKLLEIKRKDYPNLFIFIIELEKSSLNYRHSSFVNIMQEFEKILMEFDKDCLLIFQLSFRAEKISKIFYKDENSSEFIDMDSETFDGNDIISFPTFLQLFIRKDISEISSDNILELQDSSKIIKFLKVLDLGEDMFGNLVTKCAAKGSILDVIAAIDGFIDEDGSLKCLGTKYIQNVLQNSSSVLYAAVQSSNIDVIRFLIKYCIDMIQQLPFEHQVEVTTVAFSLYQFGVLSDLLKICDFPFPMNFDQKLIKDQRLQNIINERIKFHEAILAQDLDKIKKFSLNHPEIRNGYNLKNISALSQALHSKKYRAFCLLKSLGFQNIEIENYEDELNKKPDKNKIRRHAGLQRSDNINISSADADRSAIMSSERHHEIIRKWFEEICKTKFGSKIMNAVQQCYDLKIIFDFECESAANFDLFTTSKTLGEKFALNNCNEIEVIVHPKLKQKNENGEKPGGKEGKEFIKFDTKNEILKEAVDDKCDGIILTVYTLYDKKNPSSHPELIVRPVYIQAQFNNNEEKIKGLEKMYKNLFVYIEQLILPEITKFCLQKRGNIQSFHDFFGIICDLKSSPLKLQTKTNLNELLRNNSTVITSNVPKLILLEIYKHLTEKYEDLVDVKNIFITPENLKISTVYKRFGNILKENSNLNIFVDCTKGYETNHKIKIGKDSKLFIITSLGNQNEELVNKIKEQGTKIVKLTINYNWMDLTVESQKHLLQTKINFQNNSSFSLSELILNEVDTKQTESLLYQDFSDIIDDQLLNLLIEKSEIKIKQITLEKIEEIKFRILFQTRNLIKKYKYIEQLQTLDFDEANFNQMQGISGKNMIKFKETDKTKELTQDQMLEDVKDKKFVLISDIAGSGKSWILKNITNTFQKMFPKKWISYVDLKQFIREFKVMDIEFEFASFLAKNIFKLHHNFEAKIFKKLYKNGKVCVIFDGYNEIDPYCTKIVTKLLHSFQQNGGNQLWIATRDYLEEDLKEKLELDSVYKLDEFTEEKGIKLFLSSWKMSKLEKSSNTMTESEKINKLKILQKRQITKKYKKYAKSLIAKISKKQNNSIGFPQFYMMIADIFQKNKGAAIDFTILKIFEAFVDNHLKRWSQQKVLLWSITNIESQDKKLSHLKLHEVIAMRSFFPDNSNICDYNIEDLNENIECEILIKEGRTYLFCHETFREYFAAKCIIRILEEENEVIENVWKFLTRILSLQRFGVVRMFLNEALGNKLTFTKIEQNLPKKVHKCFDNANDYKILTQILEINYKYLACFLIKILNLTSTKKIKEILLGNKINFVLAARNENIFDAFQNILMENFCAEEVKEVLIDNAIILSILVEIRNECTIENFLYNISNKISLEFVKEALQMKDGNGENLLFYLIRSKNSDENKCKRILEILQKYLSDGELVKLAIASNNSGTNLLHICVKTRNIAKFKFFWNELIKIYTSEIFSKSLKNIFYRKLSNDKNILHIASTINEITFHNIFWKFLIKAFENREELKDLILQKDRNGNNFIHNIVILNQTSIIKFYVNKIKENFAENQFQEIFSTKGCAGRNLLHIAACSSKGVKTHRILWQTFRNFHKTDNEFLEFIKETDNEDSNVVTLTAYSAESEELEFMINELKKIVPTKEIKQMLGTLNFKQQNMLHVAAKYNLSLKFHQSLWKIIKLQFNSDEVFNMIKDVDEHTSNILAYVIEYNTKEVLEFTWKEIKNYLGKESVESFEKEEFISNSFYSLLKVGNEEKLKYFWSEINYISKSIRHQLKELLNYKTHEPERNTLHSAAFCKEVKFHRVLWDILIEYCNHQEIKQFLNQKNIYGYNFTQLLVISNNVDVIEFTFQNLQKYLLPKDFEEISKSKDSGSRNLLQNAARFSTGFQTYKFLWEIYKKMFSSGQEFIDFIAEIDVNSNNIFYNVASFASSKIFKFILSELEKLVTRDKIRKFLSNFGDSYQNLLQVAAKNNNSLDMHKTLWKVMRNYFQSSEILEFFHNTDERNYNLFLIAVRWNTKEIVKFTWENIATFMNQDKQVEYLKSTGTNGEDILKISLDNRNNKDVYDWVMKLLDEYEILLKAKDMDSNSFEVSEFEEFDNKSDEELHKELLNAIQECNIQKVLITIRNGADVNQADKRNFLAIEYAWLNYTEAVKHNNESEADKFNEIMLALLNANSKFPSTDVDFCYENAPKSISSFIDLCESVHRHIFENNFEEFKKVIYNNSHLRYFHDRYNETAYLFALKRNNFFPLDNLNSIISIREDESTREIYYEFTFDISDDLSSSCNKLPPLHIVMLNAKSRIYNTSKYHESLIHINNAFKVLNSINSCSVIIKLLSVWKKLKIKFDFKHEAAYYFHTNLDNLSNGIIVIGAKEFVDYKNRYKVISALINQLFHSALYITYMNSFNPYPLGESVQKDQYNAICNDIIEKNVEIKPNLSLISSEQKNYEFIVRAMEMIIFNFENYSMIVELQKIYGHLYDYLNNFVVPQMEAAMTVIKKIQEENEYFTFNDLTDSLKRKILHSKIKFQGQETTFYEMFENDEEILKLLTPKDIRRLLLRNENFKLGCSLDINLRKCIIDRKFICVENIGNECSIRDDEKTFDDIVKKVETFKIFTLCDSAGAGKTVTFKNLTLKLKQKYKPYWVTLVELRDFYDVISKIKNNFNENIFQDILKQVSKIDSNIDAKVYEKLYKKGKVIILFDGVDEILPKCSEIFTKMVMEIRENSRNQIWISTRPHFADKLKQLSKGNVYKLSTITKEDKNMLIKEIWKNSENILYLADFLDIMEYNSPLIINIMADLVAKKEINFQTKSYNSYQLFDKLIEKLTEKFYIKIPFEDNLIKTRFTIDEMHKVFALKSIFNSEHDHYIKNLIDQMAIMKNWHRDEKKWTFDKIQRYGFLSVNIHGVNKECIGFIHKTYEEYFLAQFIISFLFYDTHHYMKVEEFEKVFELLRILANSFNKFKIALRIIVDFAESDGKVQRKQLYEKIRETIIKNMKFIAQDVQKSPQAYNFWHDILIDDLKNDLDELVKRK